MPKVSIIIPVYNVEEYLDDCMKSVQNQRYEEFEVILVDDGSTDGSAQMCDNYAQQDLRIRVIHKKNGGLASAVKKGVEQATGEFLYFIDSDDEVNPNGLTELLKIQQAYGVDLVCAQCDSDREKVMTPDQEYTVTIYTHEQIMPQVISNGRLGGKLIENSRCAKLFRAEAVRRYLDFYNPEVKKGEDQMMTLPQLLTCSRVAFADGLYSYYYRLRNESICGKCDLQLWNKLIRQQQQTQIIIETLSDRDLTEQGNNQIISAAFASVSTLQKSDEPMSVFMTYVAEILNTEILRKAFKNHTLKESGVCGLIIWMMRYRMTLPLCMYEKYISRRRKKELQKAKKSDRILL